MSFDNVATTKTGGTTDAVLIKFDSDNGNIDWLKNLQDPHCDRFDFINIDKTGNIYVLNNQYGYCISPGWSMLAKFNSNGDLLYKDTLNGSTLFPNAFPGNGVAMTRAGNISLPPDGGSILVSGSLKSGQNVYKGFIVKYGICNTPNPTVNITNPTICEGDSATLAVDSIPNYKYLWSNGDTTAVIQITESGRYSVVAIEDEECYSESEDFYINVHPYPDTSVTVQNNILTATENGQGTTYQWIDCENNNMPISGATEQIFEPTENGEYAVVVTSQNGCSDTSSSHVINTLSIQNNPLATILSNFVLKIKLY